MLKNYIRIAIRSLLKHKGYTAINMLGLTIGITSFILICLYIQSELSYDKFHSQSARIYRIHNEMDLAQGKYQYPTCTSALPVAIQNEIAGVENYVRFSKFNAGGFNNESIVRIENDFYKESRVFAVDPSVFNVFSFRLLEGNPERLLQEPFTVVISEETAQKYFKSGQAIGRVITFTGNNQHDYKVTGIIENPPHNSHIKFDILVSMSTIKAIAAENAANNANNAGGNNDEDPTFSWVNDGFYSYLLLSGPQVAKKVLKESPALVAKNTNEEEARRINVSLIPLTDIHLHSSLRNELEPNGSMAQLYIFIAIAIFILSIAGINYMNLATARSARRAREVGMRKVLGAERKQLILQFLGESIILTLAATIVAIFTAWLLLPAFNNISGKGLSMNIFSNGLLLIGLVAIILLFGLLSGSYPAFVLSSFQPVEVLKGKLSKGINSSAILRKSLVTFQFVISIILVIGTWLVYNQINFLKNKNLGFDKEHILVINNTNNAITPQLNVFKNELLKHTGIKNVTASFSTPGGLRPIIFVRSETVPSENNLTLAGINVDFDYLKTMGIKPAAGRDFNPTMSLDSTEAIIINKQAVKELNLGESPVGKMIEVNQDGGNAFARKRVIGVVEDVNFEPLYRKTEGAFYAPMFPFYTYIFVKLNADKSANTIEHIRNTWQTFVADQPFDYSFLDTNLNQLYQSEDKLGKVITYFAFLAIIIACLGLFGLASFATEQRTKEIGIRKVLGASEGSILLLLSKEYTQIIIIATLISWPLAYYLMYKWMENFAYHTGLSWYVFILAGILVFIIAMFTVSFKALRAAQTNPTKSLRSE